MCCTILFCTYKTHVLGSTPRPLTHARPPKYKKGRTSHSKRRTGRHCIQPGKHSQNRAKRCHSRDAGICYADCFECYKNSSMLSAGQHQRIPGIYCLGCRNGHCRIRSSATVCGSITHKSHTQTYKIIGNTNQTKQRTTLSVNITGDALRRLIIFTSFRRKIGAKRRQSRRTQHKIIQCIRHKPCRMSRKACP